MRSEIKSIISHVRNHSLPPLTDDCYMPIGKHRGKRMGDLSVEYYESLVKLHTESPRVYRGPHWIRVIDYIRAFKNK